MWRGATACGWPTLNERSPGKTFDFVLWKPREHYLLDPSLNPQLAPALRLADWDILSVFELFNAKPTEQILDEQIIPRCREVGRIWVTADEAARRRHIQALDAHDIYVLWIRRQKGGMGSAFQLAHLSASILKLDVLLAQGRRSRHRHYEVSPTLGATVKPIDERR